MRKFNFVPFCVGQIIRLIIPPGVFSISLSLNLTGGPRARICKNASSGVFTESSSSSPPKSQIFSHTMSEIFHMSECTSTSKYRSYKPKSQRKKSDSFMAFINFKNWPYYLGFGQPSSIYYNYEEHRLLKVKCSY